MKKKFLFVVFVSVFASFFCASSVQAALGDIFLDMQAKAWDAKIKKLESQRKFSEVAAESSKFINWLKDTQRNHPKLKEYFPHAFDAKANAQAMQGYYNSAANTIREKNTWAPSSSNIDKVMTYERKDLSQKEFYNLSSCYHKEMVDLKKELLSLATQKNKLVQDLLKQKDVKKEELEKLQKALKELDERTNVIQKKVGERVGKFFKETEQFRKEGLVFTFLQNMVLGSLIKTGADLSQKVWNTQKEVRAGLLKVSEKFQQSWDGLEEKLNKLRDVHAKVLDLQKKLLDLMARKPLTDGLKKEIMALKERLDKALDEHAKLMAEVEKSFMDTAVFNKLTPDQQKRYMDIFAAMRKDQDTINSNTKRIVAFIKEMTFKFGDLNNDGKIDGADSKILAGYLFPRPWPFSVVKLPYNRAADLDGDGRITFGDLGLLNSYISGDRKVFPVDPDNKPGDLNGNGRIDNADIDFLAKIMTNPKGYAKAFIRLADLNNDGKVDAKDMVELVKKLDDAKKLIVVPIVKLPISTTAIGTSTGNVGTDPASSTVVDTTSGTGTGTRTPASSLGTAW